LEVREGPSLGALWTVYALAGRLGLEKALGTDRQGRLALWQVLARVLDQGSRLSAARLAGFHAAGVGLPKALPGRNIRAVTRKRLSARRKNT